MFFDQTFAIHDLAVVGLLVVLEGVLSIDNALVLGLLAKRLPKRQQARALTWGLVGAFVFRFIAIGVANQLLKIRWVKLLGGLYLIYVGGKYFWELWSTRNSPQEESKENAGDVDETQAKKVGFWTTVLVIELTDIAFAVDSIVAAMGVIEGPGQKEYEGWHPKLWVVITGGMLGVILMRYAAVVFIKLLERFPRFETAAYLLVLVIGGKLVLDWRFNIPKQPPVLDFHSPTTVSFWAFWLLMLASFCVGFIPKKKKIVPAENPPPEPAAPSASVPDQVE